jgi:hypothetical protein
MLYYHISPRILTTLSHCSEASTRLDQLYTRHTTSCDILATSFLLWCCWANNCVYYIHLPALSSWCVAHRCGQGLWNPIMAAVSSCFRHQCMKCSSVPSAVLLYSTPIAREPHSVNCDYNMCAGLDSPKPHNVGHAPLYDTKLPGLPSKSQLNRAECSQWITSKLKNLKVHYCKSPGKSYPISICRPSKLSYQSLIIPDFVSWDLSVKMSKQNKLHGP